MQAMWVGVVGTLALAGGVTCTAQTVEWGVELGGQARLQWTQQQAATAGPVAQANALQAGTVANPDSGATVEAELRASGHGITAVATLQQNRWQTHGSEGRAWVNELFGAHDGGAWQYSAGKKIVAWDVGYGFRPNDMVQQEERRALVSSTAEGRPLVMAEHFTADTAWSLVGVNPTAAPEARGALEPALAARVYRRDGAVDWHGFARLGAHTGASVGAAMAWVASDAVEVHGSLRYLSQVDSQAINPTATGLVASTPWQAHTLEEVPQLLLGGTWTTESQLSLLAEAWWDGAAQSDAQWDAWAQRNTQLAALATRGAPATAVAGNLAWQAEAFGVSPNLRRSNVLVRLSWQNGAWSPALDVLYTPADQGRMVTASLSWQGDRVLVQGGWRAYGGPAEAVLAQLPSRSTAYLCATWSF